MVEVSIDFSDGLTEEQKGMLESLKNRPVVPDEDCPAMTEEQLKRFRRVSEVKRGEQKEQSVTIHLSSQALEVAKSFGEGYTSILSRILEGVLFDTEVIKHYL